MIAGSIGLICRRGFAKQVVNLLPEDREISFNDVLQNLWINQVIGVREDVSCADDSPPRHMRVSRSIILTQLVRGLANDFQIAAYSVKYHGFFRPSPSEAGRIRQYLLDTVFDVVQIELWLLHRDLQWFSVFEYLVAD